MKPFLFHRQIQIPLDIPDIPVSGTVSLHVKMSCIGSPVRKF